MADSSRISSRALRVLFAAAEADPIIKVGGLSDVTGSLPRALRSLDPAKTNGRPLDVRLVIPYHPVIRSRIPSPQFLAAFDVPHPAGPIQAQVFLTTIDDLPVYLIAGAPVDAFTDAYSQDMHLNGEKYTFFSLAILEMTRAIGWRPDILHAHDWHAALAVYGLKLRQEDPFYRDTRSILTIHNLPHMGGGTERALASFAIPPAHDARLPDWGNYQPLPMGMSVTDYLSTVSPTYAQEILTPAFGSGLQDFLQMRAGTTTGILNGLDFERWNPESDKSLVQPFDLQTISLRAENKRALLNEMGLSEQMDRPLLIFIGRMDMQKGVDIAISTLHGLSDLPWQAIFLGTGDPGLQEAARALEAAYPQRVKVSIRFDGNLSRRMYAGGDILLMPSRYEPCGLAQMIAMRYGCVPVVRATGGLRDTVRNGYDPASSNGYLFAEATPESLGAALRRAIADYTNQTGWTARQMCGMKIDFSWQQSAQIYAQLYTKLSRN